MSAERVGTIDRGVESTGDERARRVRESFATTAPLQLKIARRPVRNRIQRLLDLADSLFRETESLARDKAFAEESNRLQTLRPNAWTSGEGSAAAAHQTHHAQFKD